MLRSEVGQAGQLELVDDLQRLGLAYHFMEEIGAIMEKIYLAGEYLTVTDLHTAALAFRLLRQHSFPVSQDIFSCFMDEGTARFKPSLADDVKGMLALYEASYLSVEGETVLEEASDFTAAHLNRQLDDVDPYLEDLLAHALEMPLHWRTQRSEARWFIEEAYGKRPDMSPLLLQLAKLDFNIVQGMHQEELRDLSRWWSKLELGKELSFARDSLVVSHLWSIQISPEPQYEACRRVFTKVFALVSTIDDIYDIYGTLEEVELFTDAVERWNIDGMKQLPDYMKKCYMALYNTVNTMAYEVLRDKGIDVTNNLKTTWAKLMRSYLKEARWYHSGHRPSLLEYMSNARISITTPLMTMHSHIFDPKPATQTELEYLENDPNILKWASIIFRFCDDLGTSSDEMARGDVPKSVQCYMNDAGATEQAARNHVKGLVREGWKKLNEYRMEERTLPDSTVERLLNLTRASQCFYQHGDGHGVQDGETKQLMAKLLFHPIPHSPHDMPGERSY
uniref:Uncharacterized protein n=1 Tax=Kalanchoe fedtschenkoi TaxID=63787 RepID=A0A7N0VMY4_KALFE